jgi:transcription elongation factor Elf1
MSHNCEPELDRTFICDDCGKEQLSCNAVFTEPETDDGEWRVTCACCSDTPSRGQLRNAHQADDLDAFESGRY